MRLRAPLAALAAATLSLGCPSEGGVTNVLVVAVVEVTPGIRELILGESLQLAAVPKTASGITVTGRALTWSSTDQSVASVSANGNVTAMGVGGPVRIRATVDGITGDAIITVRPVPVDHVTVSPTDANLLVGATRLYAATAFDAASNILSGRSFLWESSDHSIATVTTTGLVIAIREGGPVTISATSEGKSGAGTASVSTRPPTRLAFASQPPSAVAGQTMTPPVQVALQDDLLTTVLGANNPVTISLAANPGGATLIGTTTRSAVNGMVAFNNLVLDRVGSGYTFQVSSQGLIPAISNAFALVAGGASQASFTTPPPTSAQSGGVLSPQPVIQLRDGSGNPVAQPGVVVTASIVAAGSSPGAAGETDAPAPAGPDLAAGLGGGTNATTNASGVATFANLSISGTIGNYLLSFNAPGMATLTSAPIALGPGAATALFIATQPGPAGQSNTPLPVQPQIQLRDASGNNVPLANRVISAAIESGAGAVGGNTSATTNGAGLAVFSGLSISGAAGSYTLRFSATGLAPAISGTIVLGAGGATQLAIVNQPSAIANSGAQLLQQPSVRLRDASGNSVAQAGVPVTATVSTGGTLIGNTTRTTDPNGVAAFTDLGIMGLVGNYTLTFTSPGLSPVTSPPIALSAGGGSKLGITTQPSVGGQSGAALTVQPVIRILDEAGNPVSQAGTTITAAIASGPAGATLGVTVTALTDGAGSAAFTDLAITGPSGSYTLRFTAPSLTQVTSGTITLGAGAPTSIAANSATSQSATVNTTVGAPPSVRVTDASANPVSGVAVTFTVASGGGSTAPASPAVVNTD
ncbi:MAG TPA: Ig-like domain-containing protein, partial [Gemmatimonadales bacterium]|nr:Ig-like domain-containing protein [Gemmatimonadales bacterium]